MNKKQMAALRAKFSGNGLSDMMVSTMSEWYDAKHRKASKEEVDFVNGLASGICPHCGSELTVMDGFSKKTGLAVRRCKRCGRTYSPLTETIFDSRKIPFSEWVEFLMHLFEFHSVSSSATDNRNAVSTGRYWLSKVFLVLRGYQSGIVLSGNVWADETFVPKWPGDRSADNGLLLRGLSKDQICIYTLSDDGHRCFLMAIGFGKPSAAGSSLAYSCHIKKGSRLIHDGDSSHNAVIDALSLSSSVHKTAETKGVDDGANPMEPVNSVHRSLKSYLASHGGYARDDIQDWLNLFAFMWNTPGDNARKAEEFIALAVAKRAKLRYRAWKKQRKKRL